MLLPLLPLQFTQSVRALPSKLSPLRVLFLAALLSGFALSQPQLAWGFTVGGVSLTEQQTSGDTVLHLNGAGIRNKFFLDVYVAALYTPDRVANAEAVLDAHVPQTVRLVITSSAITRQRLVDAITEGVQRSAGKDFPRYAPYLDQVWEALTFEVKKGDIYDFRYLPDQGVSIVRNGEVLRTIPEFEFKRVLFGIWLGKDPVQASLKKAMLHR
ncbi:conserved hypothetical protein [gamma proteobacterium HdN1]|nr:conserved hypothetical protein [gamma proteobacterium HdN1]